MSAPLVVVAGALASKAGHGGEAWVRLGWIRGLQELGCEVAFVEVANVPAVSPAADWFTAVTSWAGLGGRAALLTPAGNSLRGPDVDTFSLLAADADMLIDISGNLRGGPAVHELRRIFRRRVYVDVDPGYTQIWDAGGLLGDQLDHYDTHLTVGDAVASCGLPTCGRRWHAVRPPVSLADWPVHAGRPDVLTTVASWRGPFGMLEHAGRQLGGKAREFRRLVGLPREVPQACEVALDAHPADAADVQALADGGWTVLDPGETTASPQRYRSFVQSGTAEISAAQGVYVGTRCGWVSDRTAAYLASGKPAVVQDTGFAPSLRGSAILPFDTPAQAAAACRQVARDPAGYAAAARSLAEEHFAAARVVGHVLDLALV
jgi:hypothetical protein